jgi:hypothetical protein
MKNDIPVEARNEILRLRERLNDAILRRKALKIRKESVGPYIWSLAMRNIKPNERPNLRKIDAEISHLTRALIQLLNRYEGSIKEVTDKMQSDIDGDSALFSPPEYIPGFRIFGNEKP